MILKKCLKYKTFFYTFIFLDFHHFATQTKILFMCLWYKNNAYTKGIKLLWYKSSRFSPWRKPIWDRNLYVSLCIEVLLSDKHWAEPIVVIAIAIITIEIEQTSSVCVPIIAPAFAERIVHCWEVRVVTV